MTWNRGLGKWGYRWVKWKRISMRKYSLTFLMFIVYAIWYQYEAIYIRSHILDIRMGTSTHQWPLKKQKLYQTLLYQTAAWIAGSECTKFWHSTFYMHLSLNQHRLNFQVIRNLPEWFCGSQSSLQTVWVTCFSFSDILFQRSSSILQLKSY